MSQRIVRKQEAYSALGEGSVWYMHSDMSRNALEIGWLLTNFRESLGSIF